MRSRLEVDLPARRGSRRGSPPGFSSASPKPSRRTCWSAKKVAAAPTLDGAMDDALEGGAPLAVKAIGGKNLPGGSTEVTLRAVYRPTWCTSSSSTRIRPRASGASRG